jgi:hypothetical protein
MSTELVQDSVVAEVSAPITVPKQASDEIWKKYALYGLLASLYILPFMQVYLLSTDEGTLDYGAVRIAQGQVFPRDFFEVIGPGTFYLLAMFFKVLGVTFVASRIYLFIISLGTAVLMYISSRRICRTHQVLPSIFLAGTYFGCLLWPQISHHADSNLFALLAAICALQWYDNRNSVELLAVGVFTGITTVVFQPKGSLLFVALLIWLLILRRRGHASTSSLGILTIGYLGFISVVVLWFWSRGALRSLIDANFIWPLSHYQAVNAVPYAGDVVQTFRMHVVKGMGWTIPLAGLLTIPFLYVAAFPLMLPAIGARLRWDINKADVLLFWLCGAALWASELHRKDIAHLVFGSPFFMILCVHFLAESRGRIASIALQMLSISCVSLAVFNLLAVFLSTHTVVTNVGKFRAFTKDGAVSFVREHVAPGEEIFAYPYCPRYYFLGAAKNPTPYSILLYNYNTRSQFQEVVQILEQRKVKYVIWDSSLEEVKAEVFPASTHVPPGGFIIEPYLESHYRLVKMLDGVRIMERKEQQQMK